MQGNHPVWDVYDQFRTARLNELYYGRRLLSYERFNFWSEVVVAVTSSSSAIAGFAFWSSEAGNPAWKAMLALAAVVTVMKPLLNLTKRIRSYEELFSGYRLQFHDLKDLRIDISQARDYTEAHKARFKKIIDKQRLLADKSPERMEHKRVKSECQAAVLAEFPSRSFFIPGGRDGR
jgi:hypothetical protein